MTWNDKPHEEPRPWTDLAGRALVHAAADRMDIAVACVQTIAERHGGGVIPSVLVAWVDTAWDAAYPDGLPDGMLEQPMRFVNIRLGETGGVDDVPPHARWAGRFIWARLGDDHAQAEALIGSLETDEQWSQVVLAVLDACASQLIVAANQSSGDTQ